MDLSIGDRVFYTRSNGLLLPRWLGRLKMDSSNTTKMVESGESAMQEGVHLLCHPKFRFATSLPPNSAAHTVKFPPKGP